MRRRRAAGGVLVVAAAVTGCLPGAAHTPPPSAGGVGEGGHAAGAPDGTPLPSGFGTLRQDDITVELHTGDVRVRLTPLLPSLIRLTAPDTEDRLAALASQVDPAEGLWVLVAVQTEAPGGAAFEPMSIEVSSGGALHRPRRIRGLTPEWGSGRLQQRVVQQALYLFSGEVAPWRAFEVRVGALRTAAWNDRLPLLDAERARVLARAGPSF